MSSLTFPDDNVNTENKPDELAENGIRVIPEGDRLRIIVNPVGIQLVFAESGLDIMIDALVAGREQLRQQAKNHVCEGCEMPQTNCCCE